MAIVRSSYRFDDSAIDFNEPFQSLPTVAQHSTPGDGFRAFGGFVTVGMTARSVPALQVHYGELFQLTSAGQAAARLSGNDLTFDGSGMLNGGTVQMLRVTTAEGKGFSLLDTKLAAVDFLAAAHSTDRTDDNLVFASALAGDDAIFLSGANDLIHAGSGDDLVTAMRGNDTIFGEGGRDALNGGSGSDQLYGGAGNDLIVGGNGYRDMLYGDDGNDFLAGFGGKFDVLTGGAGRDTFVFALSSTWHQETVTDFVAGIDRIVLNGSNSQDGSLAFADLTIRQTLDGALISFKFALTGVVERMLLEGVDATTLKAADFVSGSDAFAAIGAAHTEFMNAWHY